jgi:DNA-binding response OmpR family regulator
VNFTKTEQRILDFLKARAGEWVAPAEIIRNVLGTHHKVDSPLVRVHVHGIRRKLGAERHRLESDPQRLRGYRWVDGDAAKGAA